jgi:16S rRNA (guanine966-N2)-methyltransferase
MHIIAGERRGRKIESPRGRETTRPITNRVKENLFNILRDRVEEAVVLDLFCGTGSLGLEALSRGARWTTFVEQDRDVARILQQNIATLQYDMASRVLNGDALRLRPGIQDSLLRDVPGPLVFDLVFCDPPYRMMADALLRERVGESLANLVGIQALAADVTIVVRRETRAVPQADWPDFELTQSRTYGSMALDFFRLAGS